LDQRNKRKEEELQEQPYSLWVFPTRKKDKKNRKKGLGPHTPKRSHHFFFSQIEN